LRGSGGLGLTANHPPDVQLPSDWAARCQIVKQLNVTLTRQASQFTKAH
jgi:hypothetical protein